MGKRVKFQLYILKVVFKFIFPKYKYHTTFMTVKFDFTRSENFYELPYLYVVTKL